MLSSSTFEVSRTHSHYPILSPFPAIKCSLPVEITPSFVLRTCGCSDTGALFLQRMNNQRRLPDGCLRQKSSMASNGRHRQGRAAEKAKLCSVSHDLFRRPFLTSNNCKDFIQKYLASKDRSICLAYQLIIVKYSPCKKEVYIAI